MYPPHPGGQCFLATRQPLGLHPEQSGMGSSLSSVHRLSVQPLFQSVGCLRHQRMQFAQPELAPGQWHSMSMQTIGMCTMLLLLLPLPAMMIDVP